MLSVSAAPPASSKPDAAASRRDACLQFAVEHIQRLGSHPELLAPGRPPSFALHSVFQESLVETPADLISLHPVYRTVRGFDEKRRRPVLYQTLVHEERVTRAVVDWSYTFHLVVRQKSRGEVRQAEQAAEHAAKRECAVEEPDCPAATPDLAVPQTPWNQLLHIHLVVSEDKDGSRAITLLRSSSPEEVAQWYSENSSKVANGSSSSSSAAATDDHPTSERTALEREAHLKSLRHSFISLPRRLAGHYEPLAMAQDDDAANVGRLKALSVNIWNYNYWQRRLSHLIRVIRESSPDVIGFQEVRAIKSGSSSGQPTRWQVADLAAALPEYEYVFQPAMGFREGHEFVQEGLAVFSRYPITATSVLKLSRDPLDGQDFHQRMCLRARVQTRWGGVNVLSTHLSLSLAARARTLPEVSHFASGFLPEPTILTGDFNAVYTAGPSLLTRPEFGEFKDAWSSVHGDSEASDREGWTFHAWDHRTRIDFVFSKSEPGETRPSLVPVEARVVGKEGWSLKGEALPPIGGVADMKDTLFPSDHMFLEVAFQVKRDDHVPLRDAAQSMLDLKSAQKRAAELTHVAAVIEADADKPVPLSGGVSAKDEL